MPEYSRPIPQLKYIGSLAETTAYCKELTRKLQASREMLDRMYGISGSSSYREKLLEVGRESVGMGRLYSDLTNHWLVEYRRLHFSRHDSPGSL